MPHMYDVITTLSVEDHLRIGNVIPCNHFSVNQHNKAVKVKCFLDKHSFIIGKTSLQVHALIYWNFSLRLIYHIEIITCISILD